jgi:hypothetical protein
VLVRFSCNISTNGPCTRRGYAILEAGGRAPSKSRTLAGKPAVRSLHAFSDCVQMTLCLSRQVETIFSLVKLRIRNA